MSMGIKKKLILMGVCIVIILVILTVNIIRKMKLEDGPEQVEVKENVIPGQRHIACSAFWNMTEQIVRPYRRGLLIGIPLCPVGMIPM